MKGFKTPTHMEEPFMQKEYTIKLEYVIGCGLW